MATAVKTRGLVALGVALLAGLGSLALGQAGPARVPVASSSPEANTPKPTTTTLGGGTQSAAAPAGAPLSPTTVATRFALPVHRIEGDRIITPDGWYAIPQVQHPLLPDKIERAFIIPIHGPIDSTTADIFRRKILQCRAKGAQLVILDIDTLGGSVGAILEMTRLVMDDLKDTRTVAYVHPKAISAGAILALACDDIAMAPTGVIGDALPVMASPGGGGYAPMGTEERAKIESYLLKEAKNLADTNGHPVDLAEGMITLGRTIWFVRNRDTRELKIVTVDDNWRREVRGGPTTRPAGEQTGAWDYIASIDDGTKLVTLTAQEAYRYSLAGHIFDSPTDLETYYNIVRQPVTLETTWSEELVGWLSQPMITGILIALGLLLAYTELHTPGFGIAGVGAILCFALLLGSHFLIGLANWWEIAAFILGVLLVVAEFFILPHHGLGIIGAILVVLGLLAMLVNNPPDKLPWPTVALEWNVFLDGLAALLIGLVGAVIGMFILGRYLPRMPLASRMVLSPVVPQGPGGPASEHAAIVQVAVGAAGVVVATCRPVGVVRFGEIVCDAVSNDEFLPKGTRVVAAKIEGNRVIVEKA